MNNNIRDEAWLPPTGDFEFQSHRVDIWRVSQDIRPDSVRLFSRTLSTDELQRASRFHFEKDRDRYIIAHASVRDIVSRYLQCAPDYLKFSANEYGKPFLPEQDVEFNLSHSSDFALIAVTRGRNVGIDIELVRENTELENLANRFFSPREISELMALPSDQRAHGFFNCWTRKEAYIKAQGLGLSLPLDSFDVSLSPGKPALLHATRPDADEASRWILLPLGVHPDYSGALAVEGAGLNFRYWNWRMEGS